MLQFIETINSAVNNFIWGVPAMVCIFGVGLYLSLRTRFLQIRKFPYAIKTTIGRMFRKKNASDGALTPFQAVCTALAATVGTGNIAGVAGAIAIGGSGAIFWMWISAILGMCTKFAEVTLAVHFREKNAEGDLVGGPMYYIKNGLGKRWMWLAYLFAAFGVLTVFGTGNATQVNTITTAINSALIDFHVISNDAVSTSNLIIGIVMAVLVALILLGGVKRIGQVTEKLVPFMALLYIVLAVGVIVINIRTIPTVFASIFEGAFKFQMNDETRYVINILISMVPIGIVGVFFKDEVEAVFGSGLLIVGCMLLVTAALLSFSYYYKPKQKENISMKDAFIIGLAQACAMLPGLSRSGTTIATGLLLGDNKAKLAQFSFLMVMPPILGEGLLDGIKLMKGEDIAGSISTLSLLIGFIAAFVAGCLACKWMINIVKKGKLVYFAVYCAIAGIVTIVLSQMQG